MKRRVQGWTMGQPDLPDLEVTAHHGDCQIHSSCHPTWRRNFHCRKLAIRELRVWLKTGSPSRQQSPGRTRGQRDLLLPHHLLTVKSKDLLGKAWRGPYSWLPLSQIVFNYVAAFLGGRGAWRGEFNLIRVWVGCCFYQFKRLLFNSLYLTINEQTSL